MSFDAHTLDDLPTKGYQIALLGFCNAYHFTNFYEYHDDFAFLSLNERYQLDNTVNRLRMVMQQAIGNIFLIGTSEDFDIWQQFFAPFLGDNCLQIATIEQINPKYTAETQALQQQEQQANDSESYYDVAKHYVERYNFNKALYYFLKSNQIANNYDEIFAEISTEKQREFIFSQLWQWQQGDIMVKFAQHCPKLFNQHITLLQWLMDKPLPTHRPPTQAIILGLQKYQEQHQHPNFADYWATLIAQIQQKLINDDKQTINWQTIAQTLTNLQQQGFAISHNTLATCYHRQNRHDKALQHWQLAEQENKATLPIAYYQTLLQNAQNWQQTLVPLLKLNRLGEFLMTLEQHDLNQLQLEYWEKILPELYEEDQLEPVLRYLLPKIDNSDILNKLYQYCKNSDDTSENFLNRLQRLKTLKACLTSDWDTVIERLEHYLPAEDNNSLAEKLGQKFTTIQKSFKGPNHRQTTVLRAKMPPPQDEIVDILYALNLNPTFYLTLDYPTFIDYQAQYPIEKIFDLIRHILAGTVIGGQQENNWNIDFPAVRSLAHLLEKSTEPMDAINFYGILIKYTDNKNLKTESIPRLALMAQRAENFLQQSRQALIEETDSEDKDNRLQKIDEEIQSNQSVKKFLDNEFGKIIKQIDINQQPTELPTLKTAEDIIKTILALTNKEHREMQRLEQEQRQAEKEQQRQADLAKKQAEENAKIEQAWLAKQEQERLEKERLEQQRLENERIEKERLEKEDLQTTTNTIATVTTVENTIPIITPTISAKPNYSKPTNAIKATSELQFFGWRVFVSRMYARINIEDTQTGQHCSIFYTDNTLQSDWQYSQIDGRYHFANLPLIVSIDNTGVTLHHLEHGIDLHIAC